MRDFLPFAASVQKPFAVAASPTWRAESRSSLRKQDIENAPRKLTLAADMISYTRALYHSQDRNIMAYRVPNTIDEIIRLRDEREPENPYLEYKSGKLLDAKNEKIFETLSREITAFGNSAGGVIIIGADEDNERCISALSPVVDASKTDSWIEDGILPRVSPPISFDVQTLDVEEGKIFIIHVPPSPAAPHQASDRRYYARRLYRVDPLLAFEIDDIRRRVEASPLRVTSSLWFESGLINFRIRNEGLSPVFDVSMTVEGIEGEDIAKQWTPGLNRPYTEPFKVIHPDSELSFLGGGFDFFQKELADSFVTIVKFSDERGIVHKERRQYYLKDFEAAQMPETKTEKSLHEIKEQVSKIGDALRDLANIARSINESAFHASGLNLSGTTLSALSGNQNWKWAGENLSFLALAEILDISSDDAVKIWHKMYGAHHLMGGRNVSVDDLNVDEEVKAKIRTHLKPPRA